MKINFKSVILTLIGLCCLAGDVYPGGGPPCYHVGTPALTVEVISSSQINLYWTNVAYESGYEIYRDDVPSGPIATKPANSTTYSDTGLDAGTTYCYYVKALPQYTCSSPKNSTEKCGTTQSGSDTEDPTVTITIPTSNPTYSTSSSPFSIGGTASDNIGVTQVTWENDRGGSGTCSGTTSWSAGGIILYSGQNIITVTALDAAGNTGTDTLTVTYDTAPPIPDPLTWFSAPAATGQTTITMTATTATDDTPPVEYYFDCLTDGGHDRDWDASTTYVDTELSPGIEYTYRVKARDSSVNPNETGWSDEASATTTPEPAENHIPVDEAVDVGIDADLHWEAGEGAVSHDVYFGTVATPPLVANKTSPMYDPGTMAYSTEYYWKVDERNAAGGVTQGVDLMFTTQDDEEPPQPDPMEWEITPHLTDPHSISMTAKTAFDLSGVEYNFECTLGGAPDSGWQASPIYTVSGLTELEIYQFQVTARDKSTAHNETDPSSAESVTIPDSTPPTPSKMTWASPPTADATSISMTADNAADDSGVEYYFDEISGNPGGSDSGWQDSTFYQDTDLTPGFEYTYMVRARDKSTNQNANQWSDPASDTIADNIAPTPDPMTWAILPYATGSDSISMMATTAFDPSGGVQYQFECTSGGGPDSGWLDYPMYEATGLSELVEYGYRVKAKDALGNETQWSVVEYAFTLNMTPPDAPTGLMAVANGGAIELTWSYTEPADFSSYCIYRSDVSGGPYKLISRGIGTKAYTDTSMSYGVTCYYVVTAVDTALNESDYSGEESASVAGRVHNTTQDTWYYHIQQAIDDAQWGDRIEATGGITYLENIVFNNKKITLVGADAATTIIDGSSEAGSVITFGPSAADSSIEGFTITGGYGTLGGGVYCDGASPTIKSCVISENVAAVQGGGIYLTNGTITVIDTILDDNVGWGSGGGIYLTNGVLILRDSDIGIGTPNNNMAPSGGGICGGEGAYVDVNDCTIDGNFSLGTGGAIYGCSGTIRNTVIKNNSEQEFGSAIYGSAVNFFDSVIMNNVSDYGLGNLRDCSGDIQNCTIVDNGYYAALQHCTGNINSCIIYGNGGSGTPQIIDDSSVPMYSCIENWSGDPGYHNIDDDPELDANARLTALSPCIDAGDPDYLPESGETDIDGGRRLRATAIDMGAHEFGKVIYVNTEAGLGGDGLSWQTAFKYLQDAFDSFGQQDGLEAGDEIWVAEGTYRPDEASTGHVNDDPGESFHLVADVAIYGGFQSGGDNGDNNWDMDDRDPCAYETILSGDIDGDDVAGGLANGLNSYQVVTGADGAVLDGFTITGGHAKDGTDNGGGIYCNAVSPIIRNCAIILNKAEQYGAGIYNENGASPEIINCVIAGNWATTDGAGLYNKNASNSNLTNCTLTSNKALGNGGGVYCDQSSPILTNCILWDNIDGVDNTDESAQIYVDVGTPVVNYSCVKGWTGTFGGTGNIGGDLIYHDPNFVQDGYWDWRQINGTDYQLGSEVDIDPTKVTIYDFISNFSDMGKNVGHARNYFIADTLCCETSCGGTSYPCCSTGETQYKKPIWDPVSGYVDTVTNEGKFNIWYNDDTSDVGKWNGPINTNIEVPWQCINDGKGIFRFDTDHFYPIDDWCYDSDYGCGNPGDPDYDKCIAFCEDTKYACDDPNCTVLHNTDFTLQYHTQCTYIPGQTLYFEASDDLFVAINNKIVINKGGYWVTNTSLTELEFANGQVTVFDWDDAETGLRLAEPTEQTISLNLMEGDVYDFDLFWAQRREPKSVLIMETSFESKPFFIAGDYHLQVDSPCMDAGDNDAVPVNTEQDIDAAKRFFDGPVVDTGNEGARGTPIVDMGAYEYQYQVAPVANDDEYSTYESWDLEIDAPGVLANDTDDNGDNLEATLETEPLYGALILDPDGSFTYEPAEDFYGTDSFTYSAYDGTDTSSVATVTITVHPLLEVYAGTCKTLILPDNLVNLSDSAVMGGDPNADVSVLWSIDTVPMTGTVDFDPNTVAVYEETSDELHPTVQLDVNSDIFNFYDSVDFVLKLEADDGQVTDEGYLQIILKPGAGPNDQQAPVVRPGGPYTVEVGEWLTLADAEVIDDGRPYNGFMRYIWSVKSFPLGPPPGDYEFHLVDNENVLHPQIRFTQPGPYSLKLWASDGAEYDDGVASVIVAGPFNNPPIVEAGGDYSTDALPPVVLNLADLTPQPYVEDTDDDVYEIKWSVNGPIGATFRPDRLGVLREVTFERPGIYTLTLTAKDAVHTVTDDVTISIAPTPWVDAGANKLKVVDANYLQDVGGGQFQWVVTVPMDDASYKDYTAPDNATFEWTQDSGPVTVSMDPGNDVLNPTVTVVGTPDPDPSLDEIKGVYKLTLEVTDADLPGDPNTDEVWITIEPNIAVQPPTKKSVYSITSTNGRKLAAFEVHGSDQELIKFQRELDLVTGGAVGLAMDTDSQYLFVTYEGKSFISMVDAVEMRVIDDVYAPGATNLAGIVFDSSKKAGLMGGKVYAVDRYTTKLYVYQWYPRAEIPYLYLESIRELTGFTSGYGAGGLALDEKEGVLYVTEMDGYSGYYWGTEIVYRYNTDNWQKILPNIILNDGEQAYDAIGITLYHDAEENKYLYTGSFYEPYLVRTNLNDLGNPDSVVAKPISPYTIGLGADQDTGNVFFTTHDEIRVYEGLLTDAAWLDAEPTDIYPSFESCTGGCNCEIEQDANCDRQCCEPYTVPDSPAGITISGNVAFKYSLGTLMKSPLIEGDNTDVSPIDPTKDEITYTIAYEIKYIEHEPTGTAKNVYVTDYLPRSLEFVDASHNWEYDPDTRTIRWYLGDLTEGANNYADPFTVRVKVNKFAKPGGEILNRCEIESHARIASVESEVPVDLWAQNDIIYVNSNGLDGSGISWEMPLRNFNEALVFAQNYIDAGIWPEGGQIWVAKGTYVPGRDEGDTFAMVEDVNIYGGFAGTESSVDERDLADPDNETILNGRGVEYVVTGADNSVLNGFTVTGSKSSSYYYAGIYCNGTSPEISNCKILGSSGSETGIHCYGSGAAPLIINNWIFSNGTGIWLNYAGAATIRNNTIVWNTDDGVWRDYGSVPEIKNCIVWHNGSSSSHNFHQVGTNVSYCCVGGGYSGTGNIATEPVFVNTAADDFHLQPAEAQPDPMCIDSGDGPIGDDEIDIDGAPRIVGSSVDMGADEYPPIKVYAGADKEASISVSTGAANVTFDDAVLESIDPLISVQDLSVLWTLAYGSATGIEWNNQEDALNPTFTFDESGYYKLKLSAFEGADEKGYDTVGVWIDLGMSLSSDPEQVHLPDNTAVLTADNFVGGVPASVAWSGPEGLVTFDPDVNVVDSGSTSTTVTFNGGPGNYQIWAVALDADGYYMGQQDIWVPVTHQQLDVSAEAVPSEITLPENRVTLIGTVSGAFPDKIEWVVAEEAQALVTFGDEHSLQTWAQFSEPGIYEVALLVYDDYDTVVGVGLTEVTVNPYDYGQLVVDAGEDQEITLPDDTVFLSGSVSGGNPTDTTEWVFNGPSGLLTIANPDALFTSVQFTEAGIYELALVVKDIYDDVVGFDIVQITVNFEQVIVDAGEDITVVESPTPPTTVNLSGTVTGSTWDYVEWISPHPYCVITPDAQDPLLATAAFDEPGIYEIALVAYDSDDNVLAGDTVTVTVSYQQVIVDAGEDQEITDFPSQNTATLHGAILQGAPASTEWVFPAIIPDDANHHGPVDSLESWVRFPEPGIYQIGLVAKNASQQVIGWDVTTVTVHPESSNLTIQLTSDLYEITLPDNSVHLTGIITGTYYSIEWVGPPVSGLVDITNEQEPNPHEYTCDVTFYEPGIYEIGLVARNYDGDVVGFEKVVITVNPEPQTGVEIRIWAHEDDVPVFLPCSSGQVTVRVYSEITGSGNYYTEWFDPTEGLLTIDNETEANTFLTFDEMDLPGTYYVGFVVRDTDQYGPVLGVLGMPITVYPCSYESVTVDAGANQEATLPLTGSVTVSLDGTVTNVPETANLYDHVKWIDPTGDLALVSFNPVDNEDTEATFTVSGTYELALVAEDASDNVLAGDTVTITINPYDQQDLYIEASAQPQSMTLLVDEKVDLTGVVRGPHDSVEWTISPAAASYVHFENGITDQYETSVTFDRPGVYTFVFYAKLQGTVVGWASVNVQVNSPQVSVQAKGRVKDSGEPYVQELRGICYGSDITFDISGDISGLVNLSSLTYEWSILDDTTGTATFTADPLQLTTDIRVGGEGVCKLQLAAKYQGQTLGANLLWIVLQSTQPYVDCGSELDYPVVAPDEPLLLYKAKIIDDEPINPAGIEWSGGSGVNFSSQNVTHPTVWFDSEGTYTLMLTYTDSHGLSDFGTVNILCKYSPTRVFAGNDAITIPFQPVALDEAFAIPSEPDFTYEWTVESGPASMVEFVPSDSVLNPEVTFNTDGDYVLKLTVHDGVLLFGYDEITIRVNKSPFSEDNPPQVVLNTNIVPSSCGTISATVEATDEHLDSVWIDIDGMEYTEGERVLVSGTWDDPQELEWNITLDTHSIPLGTSHTITAHASDKSGNIGDSVPEAFTTDCVIYEFAVNPDVLSPASPTIDFSAEIDPAEFTDPWTLQVLNTNCEFTGHTPSVSVPGVDMAALGLATDGTDDGVYVAQLSNNGDTANVSFSVMYDAATDLVAELDGQLKITYDSSGMPVSTIPVITEGHYDLYGRAWHPDYPDEVSFKIVLYDDAGNETVVTPGDTDAFGYRHDAVGASSKELFGTLNLSAVANGIYTIHLIARCGADIATDQAEVAISVPLKIGNVTFSQEDLTVDVGGFPLTVTRTYDSLNKNKVGDFGYGWQYSFTNMDISLNEERDDMVGWTQRNGGEFDRDVTLNLPDGRRVTFAAYMYGGGNTYYVRYDAPEDVKASLHTENTEKLTINTIAGTPFYEAWWNDNFSTDTAYFPVDLTLHDISGWYLRTEDGTVYNISRRFYRSEFIGWMFNGYEFDAYGKPYLKSIDLPSGDEIIYSVNTSDGENPRVTGVSYERCGETVTSESIQIERDETGCITGIWGPGKNTEIDAADVKYTYEAGNLVKVEKLVDAATSEYQEVIYSYTDESHVPSDHYITDILDGRGLSPIRYVYDEGGRMVGVYDVRGNYIELAHDDVNDAEGYRTETITNRLGQPTTFKYDDKGRVVKETRYLGTAPEPVIPVETQYQYDRTDIDSPSVVIDPLGNETYYYYDNDGRNTKTIDPELNVTTNGYDSIGNVEQSSQWRPLVSTPTFPDDYDEVLRTVNTYYYREYGTNVLNLNKKGSLTDLVYKTEEIDPSTGVVRETRFTYLHSGLLSEVRNVDLSGDLDDVITKYKYDQSDSNSADQPYSISNPYYEGESAKYTTFYAYDDSGNRVKMWQKWEDPTDGDNDIDKTVYTFTEYDAQSRVKRTSRGVYNGDGDKDVSQGQCETVVELSRVEYDSIGKVDYTVNQYGVLTKNLYNDLGNLVETLVYETENDYLDHFRDTFAGGVGLGYPDDTDGLLIISQTLYDIEGRKILMVGPHAPGEESDGTETVYDELGRAVETRKWADVAVTDLVWFKVEWGRAVVAQPGDERVGRMMNPTIAVANAWDGTGTQPASIGWTSGGDGDLPVVKSPLAASGEIGPLSYAKTLYDIGGRVQHSVALDEDAYEQITTYEYDNAGKQTAVIDPCGHDVDYTEGIALYDGSVNAYTIDLSGITFNSDYRTVTQYEGTRRKSVTDALDNTTEFSYDALGRLIKTTHPEAAFEGSTGEQNTYTHIAYDGLGRKQCQSNQVPFELPGSVPETEITYYEYDPAGRLTSVILPEVAWMERPDHDPDYPLEDARPRYEYVYDDFGNLIETRDNIYEQSDSPVYTYQRATTFGYDHLNNQIWREMPDGATEYKEYDSFGRIYFAKDFEGQVTGYEYDLLGRLEYKDYYINETEYDAQNPAETVQYVYDNLGRKEQVIETPSDRTTTYSYDAQGRIESVAIPGEGTVTYAYDPITGRKVNTSTDSGNINTDYFYDEMGRLAGTATASEDVYYVYDEVGNRDYMEIDIDGTPVGYEIKTDYIYNQINRLTNLIQMKTGGSGLATYNYTLNADGMRHTLDETLNETRNITYTYDELNRLTNETAVSNGGYETDYAYDVVGNRVWRQVVVNSQTLDTEYAYYPNGDKLHTEIHSGPIYGLYLNENERYYAYAAPAGGFYYRDSQGNEIGSFKAFFMGLPSVWSRYLFVFAMAMLPILLFGPALLRLTKRYVFRRSIPVRLRVPRKGICLLLAFVMLFGPENFQQLAQADIQYANLNTASWANGDTTITYTYDANGSVETKVTTVTSAPSTVKETVTNTYNLQNRLAQIVREYDDAGDKVEEFTAYTYNDNGIRVRKHTWSEINDTPQSDDVTTVYLVDSYNHTGCAQVLEEKTYNGTDTSGAPDSLTTYLIGDDVIAQTVNGTTEYLLYDGHGSTRQLAEYDSGVSIVDAYSYDGYGVLLQNGDNFPPSGTQLPGYTPNQATNLLYAGEQFDTDAQQYYLRARYYDPLNGRFNRMDPFAGSPQDPQSLHKYLYCHANPINGTDPSGMLFSANFISLLSTMYTIARIATAAFNAYCAARSSANAVISLIRAVRAFRQGNRREGVGYICYGIIEGISGTLNIIGLVAFLKAPPTGLLAGTGTLALSLSTGGSVMYTSISVAAPAFVTWVYAEVVPLLLSQMAHFAASSYRDGDLPSRGEPDSSAAKDDGHGKGQIRDYGPDGKATKDFDFGHDHSDPPAGDPHVHDWDWENYPHGHRGPPRPLQPGE